MIDTVVLCGKLKDLQYSVSSLLSQLFIWDEQPDGPEDPTTADAHLEWLEQQMSDSR